MASLCIAPFSQIKLMIHNVHDVTGLSVAAADGWSAAPAAGSSSLVWRYEDWAAQCRYLLHILHSVNTRLSYL